MDDLIDIETLINRGLREFGPYIDGVDSFLAKRPRCIDKSESSLETRPPEAYIRNILAVGILNLILRKPFTETSHRVVVIPDCLKDYSGWECCKAETKLAAECTQCNSDCLMFETMERFQDSGTEIILVPDDLEAYLTDAKKRNGTCGVVGVACILTLLSGFRTAISLRLPTQGVFLNYSSCRHHWADPGYNTNYSFDRMAYILGKETAGEPMTSFLRGQTYSLEKKPLSPIAFYRQLDIIAEDFERDYLPELTKGHSPADPFETSRRVIDLLVPDMITRDQT